MALYTFRLGCCDQLGKQILTWPTFQLAVRKAQVCLHF